MKWLLTIPFLLAGLLFAQSPVVTFFNQAGPAFALNTNGLLAWYRADAEAYAHNDEVTTWTDQKNAFDLADLYGAGSHPTFLTNQINGYPAVSFDGTDDTLYHNVFNHTGTGITVFVVAAVDLKKNFGMLVSINNIGDTTAKVLEMRMDDNGTNAMMVAASAAVPVYASNTIVTNAGFKLWIARRDDTLGTNALIYHPNAELSLFESGTSEWYSIAVGGRSAGTPTLNLQQRQAEIAIFGYSMNPTAISNAVNYFTNKYNLY